MAGQTGAGGVWIPDPNPIAGIAATVNQVNQNRLFPLIQRGKELENQQAALNLQTGQVGLQRSQVGLQTDQTGLQSARAALQDAYRQRAYALIASTQDNSEVPAALTRGAQMGLFPPDFVATVLGGGASGFDPKTIEAVRNQAIMNAGTPAELKANVGDVVQTNTGPSIVSNVQRVGLNGAEITPATGSGARLATGLSPGEATSVAYTGVDQNTGAPKTYLKGDIAPSAGAAEALPPSAPEPGSSPPRPQRLAQGFAPQPGGRVTGLAPGEGEAMASERGNQQTRVNTLQAAFEGSRQRQALMDEMRATLGEFRSGPGAEKWAGIVTEWNRVFGTDFQSTPAAAQQVFGKMAEMIASQQRDALGLPGTNAGAEAARVASPQSAYSPEAISRVLAQFEGNEEMLQTKQAAWQAYKAHGGKSYNQFVTQFNRVYDPRFFWEKYMTPSQSATMLNSMTADQRKEYEDHKKTAMGLRW